MNTSYVAVVPELHRNENYPLILLEIPGLKECFGLFDNFSSATSGDIRFFSDLYPNTSDRGVSPAV